MYFLMRRLLHGNNLHGWRGGGAQPQCILHRSSRCRHLLLGRRMVCCNAPVLLPCLSTNVVLIRAGARVVIVAEELMVC